MKKLNLCATLFLVLIYSVNLFAQIPTKNLKLYVKADSGITESSGLVSNWADRSGNSNDMYQGASGYEPSLVTNSINGHSVLRFASGRYLNMPSAATLGIQNSDYEVFIVARSTSVNSNTEFLLAGTSIEQYEFHLNGSVGARFIPNTANYVDKGVSGDYTNTNTQIFNLRATDSYGFVMVNGVDSTKKMTGSRSSFAGNLLLGIRGGGSLPFNGDIAEVIIYNAVLTNSARDSVQNYLKEKYGLEVLPAEISKVKLNSSTSTSFTLKASVKTYSKVNYKVRYGTSINALTDSTTIFEGSSGASTDNLNIEVTGLASNTTYFASLEAEYTTSEVVKSDTLAIQVGDAGLPSDSLKLWYAADYGFSSFSNGDKISLWYDVSGNGNNGEQTSLSKRPTFTTSVINGKPVARFDGSSSSLTLPNSSTLGIQSSDYEFFVVVQANEKDYSPIIGNNYTAPTPFVQFQRYDDGIMFFGDGSYYLKGGTAAEYYDSNFHVVNANGTATAGHLRVDYKLVASNSEHNFQNSKVGTVYIGTDKENGYTFLEGDIAEVIIYNRKLSSKEQLAIHTYLSDKYALELPVSTPSQQVSNISFVKSGPTSATVSFTAGNGLNNLVLIKAGSAVDANPVDSTTYSSSTSYGNGTEIGSGNFVVNTDGKSSVTIKDLTPGQTYHVAVYSFNGESGFEKYLTTSPETESLFISLSTTITNVSPAKFSYANSKDTTIEVTFSGAMSPTSFTSDSTFVVWGSQSGKHSGTFSFSESNSKVTFNPDSSFIAGESVIVTLSSDLEGAVNPFESATTYSFTIETGNSNAVFEKKSVGSYSGNPTTMEVADVNNDGYTDIILARSVQSVFIYINNGDSTFATPVEYAINKYVKALFVADFDNDGDSDFAAGSNNGSLNIFRNNGDGTFATSESYSVGSGIYLIKGSDFDNDGDIDLVMYREYNVTVYKNENGTSFSKGYELYTDYYESDYMDIVISDLDNDGYADLIINEGYDGSIYTLTNNKDGSFSNKQSFDEVSDATTTKLAVNDIDGDGDADIIVGSDYTYFYVYKNNGDETYSTRYKVETPINVEMLLVLDMDGDEDLDVLISDNSSIYVLINNGSGSFITSKDLSQMSSFYNFSVTDFNKNGLLDLVFAEYDKLDVYLNSKQSPISLSGTEGWRLLASPVGSLPYSGLLSTVWTQGFTGASTESGSSNVYYWDRSTDNSLASNWKSITSLSDTLYTGAGVLVYLFSDDNGPLVEGDAGFPKTFNFAGFAPSGDQELDNLLNKNTNGLALMGNPFQTTVDWDEMSKTDLTNVVYVWDAVGKVWKNWNGSVGGLTDGIIAPFTGFFVQSTDINPTFSIPESENNPIKAVTTNSTALSLTVSDETGLSNRAWIQFSETGETGFDSYDALKLTSLSNDYVQIGTVLEDGNVLDINHLPYTNEYVELPIELRSSRNGIHTIELDRSQIPGSWNVSLFDNQTGEETNLANPYSFSLENVVAKSSINSNKVPSVTVLQKTDTRFTLRISGVSTSIEESAKSYTLALNQNYPNPFNPSTNLSFSLDKPGFVKIRVYDVLGRLVAEPVSAKFNAGNYNQAFNASALSSGIYFYSMSINGSVYKSMKMTLIK